ncbi:MAG: formate dehydrogenase accessory sulfurtransferase FdhD [Actinomycetota bacterium]
MTERIPLETDHSLPASPRPGATVQVTPLFVQGDGTARSRTDVVATEEPLEIRVHARGEEHAIAVTMRTPGHDFELAVGYRHGEGMARRRAHVARVSYCASGPPEQLYNLVTVELSQGAPFDPEPLRRHTAITSACGVCGKASIENLLVRGLPVIDEGPVIKASLVLSLPRLMRAQQRIFDKTGGLHAAALFTTDGVLTIVREDVGRHNAVDKVAGSMLLAGRMPLSDRILMVSGRASFEIVQKAAMAGIPIVASVSAPSSLAVQLAKECNMTLCGFVREDSFAVYAGTERVTVMRS